MKSYLIDEISNDGMEKIRGFLGKYAVKSSLSQIFWVRIPDDLLSEEQYQHKACYPHVFAVELGNGWVRFELYVRSLHNMRCTCPGYCTRNQQEYVISYANSMIDQLQIRT